MTEGSAALGDVRDDVDRSLELKGDILNMLRRSTAGRGPRAPSLRAALRSQRRAASAADPLRSVSFFSMPSEGHIACRGPWHAPFTADLSRVAVGPLASQLIALRVIHVGAVIAAFVLESRLHDRNADTSR